MSTTPTTPTPRRRSRKLLDRILIGGIWRAEVDVRRRELEHRRRVSAAIPAKAAHAPAEVRKVHLEAIDEALEAAQEAVSSPSRLRAWWTGTAITRAWESVHEAEGELLEVEDDDAVRRVIPRLESWMDEVVTDGDIRKRLMPRLAAFADGSKALDRTIVREAHALVTRANNERHASQRTFRNQIISAAVGLFVLLVTLAIWHAVDRNALTLCSTTDKTRLCLAGSTPAARDVALVELVGAIAGLLSVAFALSSTKDTPARYNFRGAQAALKPVAGAATALFGVLLIQSQLLVAPAKEKSEALLVAYAALFGFSQQLFTRFVDKKAVELLGGQADKPKDKKNA
jgi:hypothetical protein